MGRLVAVKEYLPSDWGTRRMDGAIGPRSSTSATDYAWGLERFVEEARVLARLDHPGIVRVHRILEAAGTAYMAMEYVDGHSLADELRSSGPLEEARARRILEGLAAGLAEVHAAGLLHRDIKPANVMLRERDGSAVLIDFGAARQQMGQQSRSLTAVLTPGYAPIEQYSAKGRQGPWTDIYSLGAVAYAALSGRVPDDATERAMGDELRPVETVAAHGVSMELSGAVMAALALDMRRRPQDMEEFSRLLGDGVEGAWSDTGPEPSQFADRGGEAEVADAGAGLVEARVPVRPKSVRGAAVADDAGQRKSSGGRRMVVWTGGGLFAAGAAALVLLLSRGDGGGSGAVVVEADPDSSAAVAEEALALDLSEVQRIQRGLLQAGFDPGEDDGLIGGGTREAIRLWQADRGLEVTGFLGDNAADVLAAAGLESFQADTAAEEARLADEARAAEQARLAEEARLAELARAEEQARLAEEARLAELTRAEEERRLALEHRRPGREFRDCAVCPEMVVVPTGSYRMGSLAGEAGRSNNEGPAHTVRIGYALAVGKYEVTFEEWDACVSWGGGCGGYRPEDWGWGRGSRPVINVSWEDAREYTRWLSRETGEVYRLLSEAEWEYAARAGTTTRYSWGDDIGGNRANCDGCVVVSGITLGQPRWGVSIQTNGDCTTCWGTCGNGRRTAGTKAIREQHPRTVARGQRAAAVSRVCCAAAPGAAFRGTSARRTAAGASPASGTSAAGSVSPGPSIDS